MRHLFVSCTALFGLSYAVAITTLLQRDSLQWLVSTHMVLGVATTIVLACVFISLAVFAGRRLNPEQRRSVRGLGWGLLCGYLALSGSAALPQAAHLLTLAVTLLWLNCVPLLWIRHGFDLYHQAAGTEEGMATIARLAAEHGITPREREVMELIVQGKSNKEIEERLFISFSTVKNHAYSLYRKMGVKSRAQLIHLVMVATSRSDAEAADGGPGTPPASGP
jgi:DNA-binding CsgD family transcriptional regulator